MRKYKKYLLGKLFECEKGDVDLQNKDINGRGEIFVNSGSTDYGIKGRTDRKAKIFSSNTITIDFFGNAYYRNYNYKMATHNHVFSLSGNVIKNYLIGLYLVGTMFFLKNKYSYNNMATWEKLKQETIILPVNGNKIDFDYIEQRIKELECERIKELSNYLSATGLDNYKLSEKDNNILNEKIHFKEINLVSSYFMRGKNVEVDSTGIFNVIPTKKKINANNVSFGGKYPYIARGESRNGMRGKIDFNDVYLNHENTISFGQDTATMYYQSDPYFTGDKIQIFKLNKIYGNLDENLALYLISSMKKSFSMFSWGQSSFALNSIAKIKIKLPFDANDKLNIDYMKNYIKAIKKITIKDVVQYKDRVIENTKKVIK